MTPAAALPDDPGRLLVPRPRSLHRLESSWHPEPLRVAWRTEAREPAWRRLEAALRAWRPDTSPLRVDGDADVVFELAGDPAEPERYRLEADGRGVRIVAPSGTGLAHGATTLAQWLSAHAPGDAVAGVLIDDRPDVRHRGLLLDVSRNRIPTLAELERQVERMAALKLNQLQLYFEHSFAYRGHEVVWRGADPLTADEIRTLAGWCAERHIELVPNQNSFGHLHRWLVHEPYRRLAECPDGVVHPFSPDPEPFSLCPLDPGSLELLRDLYGQLLPCFPSGTGLFHVGLDETFDLGLGRSRAACERLGKHRVYTDFLGQVRDLAAEHGRRILFWGDVLLEESSTLDDVPADAVALAWGYEADHPWNDICARLAAGRELWICPGTSSWNSFTGRSRNLLDNTARAAAAGREHGADGFLLCDWGDHGHLQPPSVALVGLVAGADVAWNSDLPTDLHGNDGVGGHRRTADEIAALLDRHVLGPGAEVSGATLWQLGDVHHLTGAESLNGSSLFFQLRFAESPWAKRRADGMTPEGVTTARRRLAELRPGGNGRVAQEMAWAADMLDLGADLAQVRFAAGVDVPLNGLPAPERRRLWQRLDELLETLGPLWTASSRPGGLETSRRLWRRVLAGLQP